MVDIAGLFRQAEVPLAVCQICTDYLYRHNYWNNLNREESIKLLCFSTHAGHNLRSQSNLSSDGRQGVRLRQKKHSTMELLSCAVLFLLWVIEIRLSVLRFVRLRWQ